MHPISVRNLYLDSLKNIKCSLKWLELMGQIGGVMPIHFQTENKWLLSVLEKCNYLRLILTFIFIESVMWHFIIFKYENITVIKKITVAAAFTVMTIAACLGHLNGTMGFTNKHFWRIAASDVNFQMNDIRIDGKYFKTSHLRNLLFAIFIITSAITTTSLMFITLNIEALVLTAIFFMTTSKSYIKFFFAEFVNQIERRFSEINKAIGSIYTSKNIKNLSCYGKFLGFHHLFLDMRVM